MVSSNIAKELNNYAYGILGDLLFVTAENKNVGYCEVLVAAEGMKEGNASWIGFFQWFRGWRRGVMLGCARLSNVGRHPVGDKAYMNMKHLEAAFEKASIVGQLHPRQGLKTILRKTVDTTHSQDSFLVKNGLSESDLV